MPSPQFYIFALSFAAAACSVVYASPTHLKRDSSQTHFACTGYVGSDKGQSGINVWIPKNNALEEWASVNGGLGNNDGWRVTSFYRFTSQNNAYQIADNAIVSAASAYIPETGKVEKQVFFVSTDNVLRSFYFNGDAWSEGFITAQIPQFAQGLSANAFRINGVTTWSIIYVEGQGVTPTLKEYRSVGSNNWRWAGNINTVNRDTAFSSSIFVNGNTVMESVFVANNVQYSTNWQWSAGWSGASGEVWKTQSAGLDVSSIAAVNLGSEGRIFTVADGSSDLLKYSYNSEQQIRSEPVIFGRNKGIEVRNESALCAAAQVFEGKQYVYAFYQKNDGGVAYALYNGRNWSHRDLHM
ncbi:hypothetical protein FRB96_004848 [Tulasnella sp. 330]|nr:hypothetical protein FRB96_004848 [Tulasnella sp. 330]